MSNVVVKEYLSHKIVFTSDGWLNATQTAKNFGKDVRGYTRPLLSLARLKWLLPGFAE